MNTSVVSVFSLPFLLLRGNCRLGYLTNNCVITSLWSRKQAERLQTVLCSDATAYGGPPTSGERNSLLPVSELEPKSIVHSVSLFI